MKLEIFNTLLKRNALIMCAAGLAFSLAVANIGWVLLCAVVLAEIVFFRKKITFARSGLEIPIIAGLVMYLLASAFGTHPVLSFSKFASEILFIVFFICWYGIDEKDAKVFLSAFAFVTALAATFGLIQYMIGMDVDINGNLHNIPAYLQWLPESVLKELALKQGRLMSTRSHPITYAECAVFGLMFIFAFFIVEKNFVKKVMWGIGGCVTLGAIIFSFSRGAWLGLATGIPVLLIVKKKKKIRFRYVLTSILIIVLFMFIHPNVRKRVLSLDEQSKGSNSVRISLWKTGIDIIKDYPLLGIGPKSLKKVYKSYQRDEIIDKRNWSELHNQYIQTAVEKGLIGLGVYIWLLVVMLSLIYATWKKHIFEIEGQLAAAALACLSAFLVMCLTENAFADSEVSLIIWFILGTTVLRGGYARKK